MADRAPQKLVEEAQAAYQAEKYTEAAQLYTQAARAFSQQGDELSAAEQRNNLCVALLQAGQSQAAFEAVKNSDQVFAAAGDIRRQALALGNQGSALEALKRLDEAEALYERSAELLRQVGEDELRGEVLQRLSALQLRSGRQLEALASMQAGYNQIKRPNLGQRIVKKVIELPFKLLNR